MTELVTLFPFDENGYENMDVLSNHDLHAMLKGSAM